MATYTKKLKTITVHQMLDGATVEIADTASDDKATRALNEFKKYETMHYETEEGGVKVTNAIPYHAVQCIEVTEAEASITKADPYGCDGGGDTVTLTRTSDGVIYYYTECGGEQKEFEDTLVIPKGTTLYFPNNSSLSTSINDELIESGECVPHTFNEDATIHQETGE